MENYYKRKTPPTQEDEDDQSTLEVNLNDLPSDPALRPKISSYNPNAQDQVRRAYLLNGPCQPQDYTFPLKSFGDQKRKFNKAWFTEYSTWLEYSISENKAYCLCCYLFKSDIGAHSGGDTFVTEGFQNWKKPTKFRDHVGGSNSSHNKYYGKCRDLMNQKQHLETIIYKTSTQDKIEYKRRLNASIEATRFLMLQGLPFRGHDESESSTNPGNFKQLLKTFRRISPDIEAVTLNNAPKTIQMTSPSIQKDIARAYGMETINIILSDLGNAHFCLMVDESRDNSMKEQMALVIRYVDRKGHVIERFVGIEHVSDTSAKTLKATIDEFFSRHKLSISKLRGQGYDGASNMRGQFNGLKSLILNENSCAYYIHCFAHQLQLVLVGVAKNNDHIVALFEFITRVLNVVGASCKRRDILRESQAKRIVDALENGDIMSGTGLNQGTNLRRACDTRWGSHYNTLVSVTHMFSEVIECLEVIGVDATDGPQRVDAQNIGERLLSFDFIFSLLFMKKVLAITNELSQALQKKDQNIVNAMVLVGLSKIQFQNLRDNGWTSLNNDVSSFCEKYKVSVPQMDDIYIARGRRRRGEEKMKNLYHYQVETFYSIIDLQLVELNARFSESGMELLLCIACLNPSNSFSSFNKDKLLRLAEFYPNDFTDFDRIKLNDQLDTYICDMHHSSEFSGLNGIGDLASKMVETGRNGVYHLVYLLLTLALTLPVSTASVERSFSAMNIIKTDLRNRINDEWLNDSMLVNVERELSELIENDVIMEIFQKMKTRKGQL